MKNFEQRSTGEERTISGLFGYGGDDHTKDAVIRVVGVGGGGGNALNNMIRQGITGIEFVVVNTDIQDLKANGADQKIQAGRTLTKGLGAGARPEVGAKAMEECRPEVENALKGADMIFITAGMGGGTGTGGAPIVAEIARKMDILTVAIVTKPFKFEGSKRQKFADLGIEALEQFVDALIVIPNDRIVDVVKTDTPIEEALAKVDDVLYNSTRGISDLITTHGLINLDFADVKTIMQGGGRALIGTGIASGENRAEKAASKAIRSELLDGMSIRGARSVLVNITAGRSLTIREATAATEIIRQEVGEDVGEDEIIFGMVVSEEMGDDLRVTVVATRFNEEAAAQKPEPRAVKVVQPAPEATRYVQEAPVVPEAQPAPPAPQQAPAPPAQQSQQHELPSREPYYFTVPQYKGEQALRDLDQPAYLRRRGHNPAEKTLNEQPPEEEKPDAPRILKLNASDRPQSTQKPRRDEEPPAFLRNMMD